MTENENMQQLYVDRTPSIMRHAMHFGIVMGEWINSNSGPSYLSDVIAEALGAAQGVFLYELEMARKETERARQREKEQTTGT